MRDYIAAYPECADELASSPFCFCEGLELNVPLNLTASTLKVGHEHREHEQRIVLSALCGTGGQASKSNDFSIWLSENLGLDELARKIDEIDLTESTLEEAKQKVLQLISAEPDNS